MTRFCWIALFVGGCFGSARVSYIDSSRTESSDSSSSSLGDDHTDCGARGIASAESYASIFDRILRVFSMQLAQPRHLEITCAKE